MYRPAEDSALGAIQPLGVGGTAEVVRAFHAPSRRTIAIKYARTDPELSVQEFSRLIHREHDLIGGYRFPGLVRLLEDPSPNFDHLVLEYCAGSTLDQMGLIDNLDAVMNIISAIALDLEFIHSVGLVHGDLKPHNLFLPRPWLTLRSDELFFLKLSDFSLGRHSEEPDQSRLGLGTVGYMAPETIRDRRTSHLSDLFALGVTAYQLLTGQHPFMGKDADPVKVNGRVCEHTPTPVQQLRPDAPEKLNTLVMQLLAKDETLRPRSGWQVCEELGQIGAGYPFRAALRPSFFIRREESYDQFIERHLTLSESNRERLTELTNSKADNLRLLLTGNFIRDRLHYSDGRFQFKNPIYWPDMMRRRTLAWYAKATWSAKKTAVLTSVIGGSEALVRIDPTRALPQTTPPTALSGIMQQFLRPNTIRRISARLAPLAYRQESFDIASRLYLQAGNLAEAERCTELAVAALTKENRTPEALALVLALDRQARLTDREYDIREALKTKGTIHKDIGELDKAEETYLRVIELYQAHQTDKLLAETYKYLGDVYRLRQDAKAALDALEKSLAVFRDLGDELEISHTLTNIGNVHWISNDTRQALIFYRNAYKIQKQLDAKADVASTLHNIGSVSCMRGHLKRGIFLFNHSLRLKKEIGNLGEIARTLNNLGYAYQLSGSPNKAADVLAEALEINRRIGSKNEILYNIGNLVSLQIAAGRLQESQRLLDEGLAMARAHNFPAHEGIFHMRQAAVSQRTGCYSAAMKSLSEVERLLPTLSDYSLESLANVRKANIRRDLGDIEGALEIARKTHDTAVRTTNSEVEQECLILLVRLTDDESFCEYAYRIISDRRLHREQRILWFGRLEFLLEKGDIDEAIRISTELLPELDDPEPDIEEAWMFNLAGALELNRQNRPRASYYFQTAERIAREAGLVPELITSMTMLGQIAKIEGDYECAYGFFKKALGLCRQVAESIDNPDDQKLFLSRPLVQGLAVEIRALGQRLGQKAKADH
jgi:serine/threonine protein kinase/tetratricopeptide (TPR) repeat protein